MHGGQSCMTGGVHDGGHAWWRLGMRGRRDGHCGGRYASYWNTFLKFVPVTFVTLQAYSHLMRANVKTTSNIE